MRKVLYFFLSLVLAVILSGCDFPGGKPKNGALQVNSVPSATVFLDGKHVGRTPHFDEKVMPGEYILKLISEIEGTRSAIWSGKVKVTSNVLTLINRELSSNGEESAGEVLTLGPISNKEEAQLAIVTNVDGVTVKLNGEFKGTTPLILTDLAQGSKEVELSLTGYLTRTIKFKLAEGYRLTIEADLAKSEELKKEKEEEEEEKKEEDKEKEDEEEKEEDKEEEEEGKFSSGDKVVVIETGTGWLRVRIEPSLTASEAAKVDVGNEFLVLEVEGDWVKIEYEDGSSGWVFGQYLEVVQN